MTNRQRQEGLSLHDAANPILDECEWTKNALPAGNSYPPLCKSACFYLAISSCTGQERWQHLKNARFTEALNIFSPGHALCRPLYAVSLSLSVLSTGGTIMSKFLNVALAAALGFAVSTPLYAADTSQTSQANQSPAWSDAQVRAAMDKCNSLTTNARAKCIVNIRPAGGGGSSLAVGGAGENTVKTGKYTEEEYAAAVAKCDAPNVSDKDRCMADAKDHFGRM
jgi:hypothetical protein